MNLWNLQSMYIENTGNQTLATIFIDGLKVVNGICDGFWSSGELRHWHMGLYGDYQKPKNGFSVRNKNISIHEVHSYDALSDRVGGVDHKSRHPECPSHALSTTDNKWYSDGGASLSVSVRDDDTRVTVSLPSRAEVEQVFGVFEAHVEGSRVPEPPEEDRVPPA